MSADASKTTGDFELDDQAGLGRQVPKERGPHGPGPPLAAITRFRPWKINVGHHEEEDYIMIGRRQCASLSPAAFTAVAGSGGLLSLQWAAACKPHSPTPLHAGNTNPHTHTRRGGHLHAPSL